jgi:hypothetical protein
MDSAVRFNVTPASIRLRFPLERKALRVMDVPHLKVVVVLETIRASPCSTKVVTVVFIRVSVELRDEGLESSKELHDVELSVGW